MADNVEALAKPFGFMSEFKLKSEEVKKADLPADVAAAFKSVEDDDNIPTDDDGTSVSYLMSITRTPACRMSTSPTIQGMSQSRSAL